MFSAIRCLFYPTMPILSPRLALRAEFGECLKPVFTNEIIFATVTCPLHNPFYGHARGTAGAGDFARNRDDVRRPPPGGGPLHPAEAQRRGFEKIPADIS